MEVTAQFRATCDACGLATAVPAAAGSGGLAGALYNDEVADQAV
jgi:hypothetical protein